MLVHIFLFACLVLNGDVHAFSNPISFRAEDDDYIPEVVKCANEDVIDSMTLLTTSECDIRSDGCDIDNKRCILSSAFGYSRADFITFTTTAYSETMPGYNDAKLAVTVKYAVPAVFPLKGVVQIWRYLDTESVSDSQVDVYVFPNRQEYIIPGAVGNVTVMFEGLVAGRYVAVYWDVGGTRYGEGFPEISDPFIIERVFPVALQLKLEAYTQ